MSQGTNHMPRRSKKTNQGCCLTSLVLWPVQLVEELINSVTGTQASVKPKAMEVKINPTVQPKQESSTDRFVDVIPASSTAPSLRFSITYEDGKTAFLKNAQKFRSKEGSPASHIPFKCYWPTYG